MNTLSQALQPELVIPIIGMLMPVAIVLIALLFAQKYQERKHATIVGLLEKGLPVPPELLRSPRRDGSPLMRAMTLVGIGLGVSAFLGAMFGREHGLWAAGLIPLAIGVAQLIALRLERPAVDADPS